MSEFMDFLKVTNITEGRWDLSMFYRPSSGTDINRNKRGSLGYRMLKTPSLSNFIPEIYHVSVAARVLMTSCGVVLNPTET